MDTATGNDLGMQIRGALLQDPRAQSLPPDQLNAVVSALTIQAQKQGLTAGEIAYRPGSAYQAPTDGYVAPSDYSAYIWIAAAVIVLMIILILMRVHKHRVQVV